MAASNSSSRFKKLHNLCVGKSMFTEIILAFNVLVPSWNTQTKKKVQINLDEIFGDLNNNVFCYMQYVIIATKSQQKHMKMIEAVLKLLRRHEMKMRAEKSRFAFDCFEYADAKISDKGITVTKTESTEIAWFMNMDDNAMQLEPVNDHKNDVELGKQSRLPTISSMQQIRKILNENKFEFKLLTHLPTESQMKTSIVYGIERRYIPSQCMTQLLQTHPKFQQVSALLKYKYRTLEFFPGELTKLKLVNWLNPSKECIVCYEDIDSSPLASHELRKRGVVCCGECGVRLCTVCTLQLCLKNFDLANNAEYIGTFECPKCGFDENGVFMPLFCSSMIENKLLNEFEENEQKVIHFVAKKTAKCKNKKQNKKKNDNEAKRRNEVKHSYCGFCNKRLNKSKNQRQHCKTCNKVFYCRAKCKRLDYKEHKKKCQR